MTTASKITLARVALIPVFMAFLLLGCRWVALGIFVVASLTDYIDGYIARRHNQVTDFGKFMDPLADKLLVFAAMLHFVQEGRMAAWAVMIVLTREFAVSGLRMVAAGNGKVLAAAWSGKIKTAATMIGLCFMLALDPVLCAGWMVTADWIVTGIIAATTLYSGFEYFIKNWNVIKP